MSNQKENTFPLVDSSYDNQEILSCIETLLSGQLTMGRRVLAFEQAFAEKVGAKFAVMVNSGSSANLLSVSAAINPARARRLSAGDYVAVPSVCWSTSIWPLVQLGLRPVLVDSDSGTLNLCIESLRAAMARFPIRAVMMVHILGNTTDMDQLLSIVSDNDMILIEDTCESLGSTHRGRTLGTVGDFGTYSFYFSHHMTTIEGGMVVTNSLEDYDLLKCLRAHGWSREQSNRLQIEAAHPSIDPRFLFINAGYNLRPMEIQAAFGLEQLKRLDMMNDNRKLNFRRLRDAFMASPRWHGQLEFPQPGEHSDPCWFGFPFLVAGETQFNYPKFTELLMHRGVDTRPIVSGNMALQPAVKMFDVDCSLAPFEGAQRIHDRGVFIGIHTEPLPASRIAWLVDAVLASLEQSGP
jgi:CDP-6-deoxy-D-xylo-4-hexulose-3-dehydrase